jgi:hypothetical protein
MTFSATRGTGTKRIAATCAILGLATIGIAAAPKPAAAWWQHGYGYGCCWGGIGVFVPPVVVAPPPAYYAAPAYYAPQQRAWIPAHWENGYWVPGHWA